MKTKTVSNRNTYLQEREMGRAHTHTHLNNTSLWSVNRDHGCTVEHEGELVVRVVDHSQLLRWQKSNKSVHNKRYSEINTLLCCVYNHICI